MINSFMLQWNFMVATQMSSWSFNIAEELLQKHYLSLPLSPGEMHLLQHLGALLHNKGLLIGESRDITIVLFSWKHRRTQVFFFFKKTQLKYEIWDQESVIHTQAYHFNNLNLSIQPKVIQEHLKVFLHLDTVIIHLSYGEDTHLALPPHLAETWTERSRSRRRKEKITDSDFQWSIIG